MPPSTPRSGDPYRVLGVAPDANLAEVKRAYRALAKRHHPDAGGTGATARFLAIQEAYEAIVAGQRRPARGASPTRGERREAPADWYADARDAARGRARQGRGDARRPGADEPGRRRGGGRAGRTAPRDGEDRAPRTATIGSTTYDDAVTGEPPWDGATWYGAASGTYWTVNPREYADPRKHGPEYLARAAAAASGPAAGGPGDLAGRVAPGADRPSWDPTSLVGRLRRRLRPTPSKPRVR